MRADLGTVLDSDVRVVVLRTAPLGQVRSHLIPYAVLNLQPGVRA